MPIAKLSLIRLSLLRTSRDAFRTMVQPRIQPERKALAKEELLTVEGIIDEIYPDGRFGVTLDNEVRIIAYTAGKMRRHRIRSIVGDRVHVEMTPYDLSKGRIVFREKIPGQPAGARRRPYRR